MGKIKQLMKGISDGKYTAREIVLAGIVLFLFGMLLGMIFSPRKNQVFGSFNGNGTESVIDETDE